MIPRFITVDGEGVTRDDGTHDYILLGASTGAYITETGAGGLSTVRCFEFLLKLGAENPDHVLAGFFIGYDANMMFRDLPLRALTRLWKMHECTWSPTVVQFDDQDTPHMSVYQYRVKWVPNRVLEIIRGYWYHDTTGEVARFRWYTDERVTVWDTGQFFQTSFVKALKEWKIADDATVSAIEAMKAQRAGFDPDDMPEIIAYCLDECRLLVKLMDQLAAAIDGAGIELREWYGSGAIGAALLRQNGVKKHVVKDDPETPHGDATLRAYFGGRIETWLVGTFDKPTINYDINSAYPCAIQHLPSLKSEWYHLPGSAYSEHLPYAIWRVKWRCADGGRKLTPFPFRRDKRIYWPHTGEGWYHAPEVRVARRRAAALGWEIEVCEGWVLQDTGERPFAWIADVYKERRAYKAAGRAEHIPLKLGMNSAYGKTAQSRSSKPGATPPFRSYYWAGFITSYCRAQILDAAALAIERGESVLAIATDGLFVTGEIPVTLGAELGEWERAEVEPGLMFLQPGVYVSPSAQTLKARGVGGMRKGNYALYDHIHDTWNEYGLGATVSFHETRFIGFGLALALNRVRGERGIWRKWVTGVKQITMSGTRSKYPDMTRPLAPPTVWLIPPNTPGGISDAFTPRDFSEAELAEIELQLASIDEQPDMPDNEFGWKLD